MTEVKTNVASANKMTVHRALAELKLLDARILKAITTFAPVSFHKKGKKINDILDVDEFKNDTKSDWQSILDLIERKRKIKTLIVESNSRTQITVAGDMMTVADAISCKKLVEYKKTLIQLSRQKIDQQKAAFNRGNEAVHEKALNLAMAYYNSNNGPIVNASSDAAKQLRKSVETDVDNVQSQYVTAQEYNWIDPLGIEARLKSMDTEVAAFEAEVDAALSTSNAITVIEIQ